MSFQRALAAISSGSSARIRRCAKEVNWPLPMPGPLAAAAFFFFLVLGAPETTCVCTFAPVSRLNPQFTQRAAPVATGDAHSGQALSPAAAAAPLGVLAAGMSAMAAWGTGGGAIARAEAATGGAARCMMFPHPQLTLLPANS